MREVSARGVGGNIQANIVGMAIASIASILSAPLIFRYLGQEGYGLLGLFLLILGILPVIDLGILPGISRAVAWYRGGDEEASGKVLTIFRIASAWMSVLTAALLVLSLALIALSPSPARLTGTFSDWGVAPVLILMAVALSIRMYCGLLRAVLMAMERQISANVVQSIATALRTLGALAFAVMTGTGVHGFFLFQVFISMSEFIAYRKLVKKVMPSRATPISRAEILAHFRFGAGVSVLGLGWMLINNTDKIALSLSLPLASYGEYSLGVHMAGVLLLATSPVQAAVLPRLTMLVATGDEPALVRIYGLASALTVTIAVCGVTAVSLLGPVFITIAGVGGGGASNQDPAAIAFRYSLGYLAVSVSSLTYLLQSARGTLRLHAIGTALHALVNTPLVGYYALSGNVEATVLLFVILNFAFLLTWVPFAQGRLLGRLAIVWWARDLLIPFLGASITGLILFLVSPVSSMGAPFVIFYGVVSASLVLACGMAAHAGLRTELLAWVGRRRGDAS